MSIIKFITQDSYYVLIKKSYELHLTIKDVCIDDDDLFYYEGYDKITIKDTNYNCCEIPIFDEDVKIIFTDRSNDLLVSLGDLNYMYVSNKIIKFSAKANIECYDYEINKSCAFDKDDNCYLLNDNIMISNISPKFEKFGSSDPYVILDICKQVDPESIQSNPVKVIHK